MQWQWKDIPHSPKFKEWSLRWFSIRTKSLLWGGVLPFCRDVIDVFYSSPQPIELEYSFMMCLLVSIQMVLVFDGTKKRTYTYTCIYIYIYIYIFGLVGRVFANDLGDLGSIPGRVIPKTLKMVLDTSLLNTQQYKVRIKGKVEQFWERSSTLPYTSV